MDGMTEKMKPIAEKGFFFPMHQTLFWSEAYQFTKSAINLMMCFYAELRWSGKGKRKCIPTMEKYHLVRQSLRQTNWGHRRPILMPVIN